MHKTPDPNVDHFSALPYKATMIMPAIFIYYLKL